MGRYLYVMRHAKSRWDQAGTPDHERGLNGRGKRDALAMGAQLMRRGMMPQWILCSTAKRARATAKRLQRAADTRLCIRYHDALYAATAQDCLTLLRDIDEEVQRAMLIGHNPGLEELVAQLTQRAVTLQTACIAVIALPIESWGQLDRSTRGVLVNELQPDDVLRGGNI